jgi:hypothetical protein
MDSGGRQKGAYIGLFECSFDKRSIYNYKAATNLSGYYIKKEDWKQLMIDHPKFMDEINLKAVNKFMQCHEYLNAKKQEIVRGYDIRADYK